jgi:cell wall-associated NlpC family hydrolase
VKSIITQYSIFFGLFLFLLPSHATAQTADTLKTVPLDSAQMISTIAPSDTLNEYVDEIIHFAKRFLGTPYHYAGSTPSGFDCSGFIYYVMGNFGIQLSRSSPGIAEFGKTVKLSELQPGDLMFFKGRNLNATGVGHVAMVVEVVDGQIKFIHSSSSRGVVIDTFNSSKYYIPRFIKAKRLDYGGAGSPKKK